MAHDTEEKQPADQLSVLREMVRVAENRRAEQMEMIDRVNKYNLGLIAFSGSFLSLLVTVKFPTPTVAVAGFFLLFSILLSLIAVRPRTMKGGALTIDEDIQHVRAGGKFSLHEYLLDIADLTDRAATTATLYAHKKKQWTIFSALLLAAGLFSTYTLYVYAAPH